MSSGKFGNPKLDFNPEFAVEAEEKNMVKESEYMNISDLALVRAALTVLNGLNCLDEPNLTRKKEVVQNLAIMQMDLEGRKIPVQPYV